MRIFDRRNGSVSALGRLSGAFLLVIAVVFAPIAARAQEVWQLPNGPACIEQWINFAQRTLNAYGGDNEFNARKPWRINQYGLFTAQGIRSAYEPDNWAQFGANKYQWMWGNYTTEAQWPGWNNANFNASGLQGLRWFVRRCVGDASVPGGPGQTGVPSPTGPSGVTPGSVPGGTTLDTSAACPGNFSMHQGSTLIVICYCAPNTFAGGVWGTGVYTHDSSLCGAARHAGAVGASGGMIQVKGAPGRNAYQGTASNGVTSSNYGAFAWSFLFPGVVPATSGVTSSQAEPCPGNMTDLRGTSTARTCQCAPGSMSGRVWGTNIYTDDSAICAAALHAGVVGLAGGTVTAVASPSRASYQGTTRNGVTTLSYGEWHGSYYFK
jgi:hypothetical protein